MHELSVTQEIIDIALEKAKEAKAEKITRINLVIGEMTGIVDDCVQFYFDFLSKDSIASGTTLSFKRIPMQVRCRKCGFSFSPDKSLWSCPQCNQWDVEVVAGREFYIDSIEVE
jgi:hydrogenase nickel incorporation protein HypA/HybF